jgi:hypothetical protein
VQVSDAAPTVVEYLPASQLVQSAVPVAVLYLPATQLLHAPPFGPVVPALQMQLATAALPIGEYELVGQLPHVSDAAPPVVEYFPATQSVHAALPVAVLYLPAKHAEHVFPSGPVKPALHLHDAESPPPVDWEFAGQFEHAQAPEPEY